MGHHTFAVVLDFLTPAALLQALSQQLFEPMQQDSSDDSFRTGAREKEWHRLHHIKITNIKGCFCALSDSI